MPQVRMFPIMLDEKEVNPVREACGVSIVIALPWDMLEPHEKQARKNHSQSLAQLCVRGGLSADEAVAILEDRSWRYMLPPKAHARLKELFTQYVYETEKVVAVV